MSWYMDSVYQKVDPPTAASAEPQHLPPLELDRASETPVHMQMMAHLREMILAGRFPLSQPMPSELMLSRHFGVNRLSLRKALARLEHAGLVRRVPRQGTFAREVIRSSRDLPFDLAKEVTALVTTPITVEGSAEAALREALDRALKAADIASIRDHWRVAEGKPPCFEAILPLVKGVIVQLWGDWRKDPGLAWLREHQVDFVVCGQAWTNSFDCAGVDLRAAFAAGTEWLLKAGHRRILFIANNVPLNRETCRGYCDAMRVAGLASMAIGDSSSPPVCVTQRPDTNAIIQGWHEVRRYLAGNPLPDAIITETGYLAVGVRYALAEIGAGTGTPTLLTLADGAWRHGAFREVQPPDAWLELPLESMGTAAVEILRQRWARGPGDSPLRQVLPIQVVRS